MGGALRPGIQARQEGLVTALAALLLLTLALLPLIGLSAELVRSGPATILHTLGRTRPWTLFLETLGLATATTALSLFIGVPLGTLLSTTDIIGRRVALFVHTFVLFLPPFLIALGWFFLFARDGLLSAPALTGLLFGRFGVVLTLGLLFSPVVAALTALGLGGVDPSLEEAAHLVAPPWRVITQILLPLARAPIALAALIVFALSVSEVGVPMFLRVQTYPAAVFSRLGGMRYAPGEAFALVLPLLGLTITLLLLERRLVGDTALSSLRARSSGVRPLALGRLRVPLSVAVWLLCGLSLAPLVALCARAGTAGLLALSDRAGQSLWTSLFVSASAATLITGIGLSLGLRLARHKAFASPLDAVALLAFVTPASVLAVGLITVWNRPLTHAIYASVAILVIGLAARYSAIGVRTVAAIMSQTSPAYERAGQVFGGGFIARMWHIVLPMHKRRLGAAWLLAFVFCLRDLETVVAFYPPGREPLPVRIFTLEANGPQQVVAALAVLHVVLTAAALGMGALLLRSPRDQRPQDQRPRRPQDRPAS